MPTADVIVLGLGAMGSAAAMHLARRGVRVIGIEQFGPAHDRGSSHGRTRICRKAYFEHPDYVPLLDQAYRLWDELSAGSGRQLFVRCGLVYAGRAEGEILTGVRRAAEEHGLSIEEVPGADRGARFPQFRFDDGQQVLHEPDAGFLWAEASVRAQLDLATQAGAAFHFDEAARNWSSDGRRVRVVTEKAAYEASSLVVAAGPWAASVLATLRLPLTVLRKPQVWFDCVRDGRCDPARMPVFAFDLPGGFFYGFSEADAGRIKVGEHTGGASVADVDRLDRRVCEDDLRAVRRFVDGHLPLVRPRVLDASVCMYTMTPDAHFILDRHPMHGNVAVAAGFSGHGFKFAPLVGQVLAELVLDGATRQPVGFLGFSRAALQPER